MALHISELANLIPIDQVNVICQALFRLIREDERTTKNSVVEGFRVIFTKFPEVIPEILSDLIQVDRKENLVALDDLIQEYTQVTGMAAPSMSFTDGIVKLVEVMNKEFEKLQSKRKKKQEKADKKAPTQGAPEPAPAPSQPAPAPRSRERRVPGQARRTRREDSKPFNVTFFPRHRGHDCQERRGSTEEGRAVCQEMTSFLRPCLVFLFFTFHFSN